MLYTEGEDIEYILIISTGVVYEFTSGGALRINGGNSPVTLYGESAKRLFNALKQKAEYVL